MHRLARLHTATSLAVLVGILCAFGLIMVGSASPVVSLGLYGSPWAILIRQAMWMGVGLGALLACSRVDYRRWRSIRGPLVIVTLGLLVLVLVPHLGVAAGGSSRWIGFGELRLLETRQARLAEPVRFPAGDKVLSASASAIRAAARSSDRASSRRESREILNGRSGRRPL